MLETLHRSHAPGAALRRRAGALPLLFLLLAAAPALAETVYLRGLEPGGEFGGAVADAGDVNKDGLPDLLIGAPLDDTGGTARGRAFLWFGRPDGVLPVAPDRIFQGASGGDQFGFAVAGIGDVNNDSYDDIAIGAPYHDQSGDDRGAVYVYYGGSNMNTVVDVTLEGETGDDRFGWSINGGIDFDGDGEHDFLVGAPYADPLGIGADAGSAYAYFGGTGGPSAAGAVRLDGEVAGDLFGWSVAEVPDFRGNGIGSFLVGAPGYGLDAGRAYLFYGESDGSDPDATIDVTFGGAVADVQFGYAVSTGGLLTGDARDDVLVGGPGHLGDRGYVRVYYGSSTPAASPSASVQIEGETGGDRFGEAVADVGNHLGIGGGSFAVGAPLRDEDGLEAGRVYLFQGGLISNGSASQGIDVLAGNPSGLGVAGDHFGASLSTFGGDLDGDGQDDLLVGSPLGNGPSGAVLGVAALVGSGSGIVGLPELPFVLRPSGSDLWELRFGGIAVEADRAELWSVESSPRWLAALGDGLVRESEALVAELPLSTLAGVAQVDLRWEADGLERSDRFELTLPALGALRLDHPWPNPFNPSTRIRFELPSSVRYRLVVLDVRGRLVRTLESGVAGPGPLETTFDGRDDRGRSLASGAYVLQLRADGQERSRRLLLLK